MVGRPVQACGESLYVNEAKTAALNTCVGGTCKPGGADCLAFYGDSDDDARGMRACSQNVALTWVLCKYDTSLAEHGPVATTAQNLAYLNATSDA
jgi:hypothetical protein